MQDTEIMSVLTGVLVVVTAIYAWTTHRYLKEYHKDRKVRHIERRLEGFYSPYIQNRYVIDKFPWVNPEDSNWDWALNLLTSIRSRAYLAAPRIRSDLEDYLSKVDIEGIEDSEEGEEFRALREKVNDAVKNDYARLLRELEDLDG